MHLARVGNFQFGKSEHIQVGQILEMLQAVAAYFRTITNAKILQ